MCSIVGKDVRIRGRRFHVNDNKNNTFSLIFVNAFGLQVWKGEFLEWIQNPENIEMQYLEFTPPTSILSGT